MVVWRSGDLNCNASSACDVIQALKVKESRPPYCAFLDENNFSCLIQCYNTFGGNVSKPANDSYCNQVRSVIVNFLFEVVDYYGENREIVEVAMNYLDRFLLIRYYQDDENILVDPRALREDPQLDCDDAYSMKPVKVLDVYALACLGIAIKLFSPSSGCPVRGKLCQDSIIAEGHSRSLPDTTASSVGRAVYNGRRNSSLTEIAAGTASNLDIANIERVILSALGYYVHPPTSFAFIGYILQLVSFESNVQTFSSSAMTDLIEHARFQADLGLTDVNVLKYPPSLIAAAAVSNSIRQYLVTLLPSNDNVYRNQMHYNEHPRNIARMRVLVNRMEMTFHVSFESDERINTLRYLLMGLLKASGVRRNLPSRHKKSPQSPFALQSTAVGALTRYQKETGKNEQESVYVNGNHLTREHSDHQKKCKSDATHDMWKAPSCLFSLAWETLLPDTIHNSVSKSKWMNEKGSDENSDLMHHYNKHIRPVLYKTEEKLTSCPASGSVFKDHNLQTVQNDGVKKTAFGVRYSC